MDATKSDGARRMSYRPKKELNNAAQLGMEGYKPVRALLLIDIQNDFVEGSFPVPDARSIIPLLNSLRSKDFDYVYLCMDWHPFNHCSFRSNNPGTQLFENVHLSSHHGDVQTMWPDHCIQSTHGAEIHVDLLTESSDIVSKAGCNPRCDSYSAFRDNGSKDTNDIRASLISRKVTEIYAAGLATEYCVQYTVLDAKQLTEAKVFLILDGCRGINQNEVYNVVNTLEYEKVSVINSDSPEIKSLPDRKLRIKGTTFYAGHPMSDALIGCIEKLGEKDIIAAKDMESFSRYLSRAAKESRLCTPSSWSGKTALHTACELGLPPLVEEILKIDPQIDLSKTTTDDMTSLQLAVISRKDPSKRLTIVKLLLERMKYQEKGIIQNHSQESQKSALMYACQRGDVDVVEELLKFDSSYEHLSLISKFHKTALMYACMKDSEENALCIEKVLQACKRWEKRLELLKMIDVEHWNPLHFAAKSGVYEKVDWVAALGREEYILQLPLNANTRSKYNFLHLAAFTGNSKTIRSLFDNHFKVSIRDTDVSPLLKRDSKADVSKLLKLSNTRRSLQEVIKVNHVTPSCGETELDLALKQGHLDCARLLLRLNSTCRSSTEQQMKELLHRLVLMGDIEAVQSLVNFADENKCDIDEGYTNPTLQIMYKCELCEKQVCLVCKDKCHGFDSCRKHFSVMDREHNKFKGWTSKGLQIGYCECSRDNCKAMAAVDPREMAGYKFVPNPLNASYNELDEECTKLSFDLAENIHNLWVQEKIKAGWSFAKDRDDEAKLHPLLLPFQSIPSDAQNYNVKVATQTLRVILSLGYSITKAESGESESKSGQQAPKINYDKTNSSLLEICCPVDTSNIDIKSSETLKGLALTLAWDSHEVWAAEKIRQGWRYAPARNIKVGLKLNSNLVPYSFLTPEEKRLLLKTSSETLKTIIALGFSITMVKDTNTSIFARQVLKEIEHSETMGKKKKQNSRAIQRYRSKLFNLYLLAAVRRGSLNNLNLLVATRSDMYIGFNVNTRDTYDHTPLYIAVKRGEEAIARRLINLGAELEAKDKNGITPLGIAAYLGNTEICKLLVQMGANILSCDKNGFAPYHYAANQGNVETCTFFVETLAATMSNDIINEHENSGCHQFKDKQRNVNDKMATNAFIEKLNMQMITDKVKKQVEESPRIGVQQIDQLQQQRWRIGARNALRMSKLRSITNVDLMKPSKDERSKIKYTPLTLAVNSKHTEVVNLLVNHGADPTESDGGGMFKRISPYERALLGYIEADSLCDELFAGDEASFTMIKKKYLHMNVARGTPKQKFQSKIHPERKALINADFDIRSNLAEAKEILEILNKAPKVISWLRRFAIKTVIKETVFLLALLFLFSVFMPIFFDYPHQEEEQWRRFVSKEVYASVEAVSNLDSLWSWIQNDLFGKLIEYNNVEAAKFLHFNIIYGGILIEKVYRTNSICVPGNCKISSQHERVEFSQLDSAETETKLIQLQNNNWLSNATESVVIQLNLFNPFHDLYGYLSVKFKLSLYGSNDLSVETDAYRVAYKRFPPSLEFEVVIVILLTLTVILTLRDMNRNRGKYFRLQDIGSWVQIGLLFIILILDAILLRDMRSAYVLANFENTNFLQLEKIREGLIRERNLCSLFLLVSLTPLLKYIRMLPFVGPVIVALFSTIVDRAVIIYMAVCGFSMVALSFAFSTAFYRDSEVFGTIYSTTNLLFRAPFVESWDQLDPLYNHWTGVFPWIYVIIVTIMFNLLIAIVSDVYPKARERSDSDWERIITEQVLKHVKTRYNDWETTRKQLEISNLPRQAILEGSDGIKHWSPKEVTQQNKEDRIQLLEEQLVSIRLQLESFNSKTAS